MRGTPLLLLVDACIRGNRISEPPGVCRTAPLRHAIVVMVCLLLAACHRPATKPVGLRGRIVAIGAKLMPFAKHVKVDVDAAGIARDAQQSRPPARRAPSPARAAEPARAAPPPDVQVDRVDAARPSLFVLRSRTHGGDERCETHQAQDACTAACTAQLRVNMLVTDPDPASTKSCACYEQDTGC